MMDFEVERACFLGHTRFSFFACISFCSLAFFRNFISFTFVVRIYLTTVLFVAFVLTLFILWTHADTIDRYICKVPFQLFKVDNMILQVFKVRFIIRKPFHKTHGYFLDIICCCTHAFIHWVGYVFASFMNTNITVKCIHSFFVTLIHSFLLFRRNKSLFFSLIIICNWSIFLNHFTVARTRCIYAFRFLLIHSSKYRLNCFFDMFRSNNFWFKSLGAYKDMVIDFK